MTGAQKDDLLFEASHPHLATDEGQNFLRGQATTEKIQVGVSALSLLICCTPAPLSLVVHHSPIHLILLLIQSHPSQFPS